MAVFVASPLEPGGAGHARADRIVGRYVDLLHKGRWLFLFLWLCIVGVGAWSFPQALANFKDVVRGPAGTACGPPRGARAWTALCGRRFAPRAPCPSSHGPHGPHAPAAV